MTEDRHDLPSDIKETIRTLMARKEGDMAMAKLIIERSGDRLDWFLCGYACGAGIPPVDFEFDPSQLAFVKKGDGNDGASTTGDE